MATLIMTESVEKLALTSPSVLRQFLAKLEARALLQPGNPRLMWQIAQTFRSLGEFEQALHYYNAFLEIEPEHREARYFISLLGKEGCDSPLNYNDSLAPPFLRLENFLDEGAQNSLWQATEALMPKLHPSAVGEKAGVVINPLVRRSLSSETIPAIRAIFQDRVKETVVRHNILERLGIGKLSVVDTLQMSLISYGDGDYFKPHTDSGYAPGSRLRELTFVYHFFKLPKRFRGGELHLFDAGRGNDATIQIKNLSCFEPVNNSILFFPSDALHEVSPIRCDSADPLCGRFAIAGWALRSE